MNIGFIFLVLGIVLLLVLGKIRFKKKLLTQIGIVVGILFLIYGLILSIQPKEYIKYTQTTITKDTNLSKTK